MLRDTLLRMLPFQGSRDRRSEFWRLIHQMLKNANQRFLALHVLAHMLVAIK